jgi:hypothetical protein
MDRIAADYDRYHAGPDIDDSGPDTFEAPLPFRALHLVIAGQAPIPEGPWGCEFVWANDSFTAYRCARNRWSPNDPNGYADWQAGDIDDPVEIADHHRDPVEDDREWDDPCMGGVDRFDDEIPF